MSPTHSKDTDNPATTADTEETPVHRHISVTLDWNTEEFGDMLGADIRDWIVQRFNMLATALDADIIVSVSGA